MAKQKTKKELQKEIEMLKKENETLKRRIFGEDWEQEYWNRFETLNDYELVQLARACLDRGDFENAKDVLSVIQSRHPYSEVRDDLSEINCLLNRIYENLRKIESMAKEVKK